MKKGIVVLIVIIALIVGFVGGYFSYPHIQGVQKGYIEAKQDLVEENMMTFNIAVECFKIDNGFYPKNSDVSWAEGELPPNYKNPYTRDKSEVYVSGKPTKLGVIGYESNNEGTEYVIYGYEVDWALITPKTFGEFNKITIDIDWK